MTICGFFIEHNFGCYLNIELGTGECFMWMWRKTTGAEHFRFSGVLIFSVIAAQALALPRQATAQQPQVNYFVNKGGAPVFELVMPDGTRSVIEGTKDADGVPAAITGFTTILPDASTVYGKFDSASRLSSIGTGDGGLLSFTYPAGSDPVATIVDPSGVHQANFQLKTTASDVKLMSAVLPYARTGVVGQPITGFGTVINDGTEAATGCGMRLPAGVSAMFDFQTVTDQNQLNGTANQFVSIPAKSKQGFVFAITPTSQIATRELPLIFGCDNAIPASSTVGLNTFIVSVPATRSADLVAIAVTLSGDGIVTLPSTNGLSAFSAAAINVGAAGSITASADDGGKGLNVELSLCKTNAAGQCTSGPPAPTVTVPFAANEIGTFTVFVRATGSIPFDPAIHRLFLRFKEGTATVGASTVAVQTTNATDEIVSSSSIRHGSGEPFVRSLPKFQDAVAENANVLASVSQCSAPLSGASVRGVVKPNLNLTQMHLNLGEIAPGQYATSFVDVYGKGILQPGQVQPTCNAAVKTYSDACKIAKPIYNSMIAGACFQILAIGLPAGPVLFAKCEAAAIAAKAVCSLQQAANPQAVCFALNGIIDLVGLYPIGSQFEVTASKSGKSATSSQAVVAGNMTYSLDLPAVQPTISDFSTSPADPAPEQSYTAVAQFIVSNQCLQSGINTATMTVVGTDGFVKSTSCTISEASPRCSLGVPGAAAEVRDTITVTIGNETRTISLIF